ncbi:MAG: hypothetical protein K9J38_12335 [Polynucleobacter sp.]|nr:hypothetical protein [Polynucleobacter sp.]
MRIKFNFFNYLDYFLVIGGISFISSLLMFLVLMIDNDYPVEGWNYIGEHLNLKKDFLISSIEFLTLIFIVSYISTRFSKNNYSLQVKINLNKLVSSNGIFIALIFLYITFLYLARFYGVDILNRPEMLSGFFRELIYYSYRTLIPFSIIFIYPFASIKLRRLIIYITPVFCWLSDSRTPILLTSLLYFIDIYVNESGFKRFVKVIYIFIFTILLVFFFSNHRGLIAQESQTNSSVQREYQALQKNYEQTFISQKPNVVFRDLITTPLSRISSHSDFLLIYSWKIESAEIGFLILNRFFGITTSKYNFSNEMKNLYKFDPGPGKMAAPGPTGIALALFKSGVLGKMCIILILSCIVISINFVINKLVNYVEYSDAYLSLLKSMLLIQWLWISPRSAIIGLIYFLVIAFFLKHLTSFNLTSPKVR